MRASEICFAASASSLLSSKLRARADRRRQGVLTAGAGFMKGRGVHGNARQALQRAVLLERVRKLDNAGHVLAIVGEVVAVQAVTRGDHKTRALSEGLDSRQEDMRCGIL